MEDGGARSKEQDILALIQTRLKLSSISSVVGRHNKLVRLPPRTMPSSESLAYFAAGAALPTLAYWLLWRHQPTHLKLNDDDEDSDDDFHGATTEASSSWGLADAPYKMVLCVNTGLGMGKGKIAAQCGHAAVGCYRRATQSCPAAVRAWHLTGAAKIALKCPSDEDFETIAALALSKGIPVYLVEDAGRTQIAAGSRTVLGLGPAPVSIFEGVSDHLKLM